MRTEDRIVWSFIGALGAAILALVLFFPPEPASFDGPLRIGGRP